MVRKILINNKIKKMMKKIPLMMYKLIIKIINHYRIIQIIIIMNKKIWNN